MLHGGVSVAQRPRRPIVGVPQFAGSIYPHAPAEDGPDINGAGLPRAARACQVPSDPVGRMPHLILTRAIAGLQ